MRARPDVEVSLADRRKVPVPKVLLGIAVKVMVWEARLKVKVRAEEVALV